jgi:hypothetical protein
MGCLAFLSWTGSICLTFLSTITGCFSLTATGSGFFYLAATGSGSFYFLICSGFLTYLSTIESVFLIFYSVTGSGYFTFSKWEVFFSWTGSTFLADFSTTLACFSSALRSRFFSLLSPTAYYLAASSSFTTSGLGRFNDSAFLNF